MKILKQTIYSATIITAFLFILSCHPKYYVRITDITDPSHPCFSISQSRILLLGPGIGHHLDITEVDSKGNRIKPVWTIQRYQNVKVRKLCYGAVPPGYEETVRSIPIEMNKYYKIYPGGVRWFYFKISGNKNDTQVEFYTIEEFRKKQDL